ncbi:MAG: hypothetical protein WAZ99_08160 [Rectinemataceae bacterium]
MPRTTGGGLLGPKVRNSPFWPARFGNKRVEAVAHRVKKVFSSLGTLGYLGAGELADYRYYEASIIEALVRIDQKAVSGALHPLDLRDYPKTLRYPEGVARVAVFIGSFDPFQMTHLTMALRFLASEKSRADLVVVVPEGSADPKKPRKTEYPFRYQILKLQLAGVFEPFILPLDIGAGADTIEIVRRFIALHAGTRLEMTHLFGSDVLSLAARFLDADLEVWRAEAQRSGVDFSLSSFVARRLRQGSLAVQLAAMRAKGIELHLDRKVIGAPSSTDFREERQVTLVLPTEAILDRLEILFRYNMNRPWSGKPEDSEGRSRWEI